MADDPILALRQKYIVAMKSGDVDVLLSLCTEDAVIMSPNDSTLYGATEFREWVEEYRQNFRIAALTEPNRHIIIDGDYATEWTTYMVAIEPLTGSGRIRDDGRSLTIWRRQGGTWKIWQMLWNSEKPIGSGTNRYMWRSSQKKKRAKGGPDIK
jgi:ketosteroid isomerase-like protein